MALAHQRIAELEAQVESLEATVQSLKEALAAAIAHAGRLQVVVWRILNCLNVHSSWQQITVISSEVLQQIIYPNDAVSGNPLTAGSDHDCLHQLLHHGCDSMSTYVKEFWKCALAAGCAARYRGTLGTAAR